MSFFDKIFGGEKNDVNSNVNWIKLDHVDTINNIIIPKSWNKPVIIFKHSTRCSISRFALKQFESEYNLEDKVDLYYLDLLNYRDISNEIAILFQVEHQSPQILIIKNGVAVYVASHENITSKHLVNHL